MPVCVNFNICDNSSECSGIAVCKTGAIYWDENRKNALGGLGTLSVDNSKCVSCGKCVGDDGCPIGAIIFAKTASELKKMTRDIRVDEEQVRELFVERYGAEAVDDNICIDLKDLHDILDRGEEAILVEEFTDDSIQCLLKSIPIESILQIVKKQTGIKDIIYRKVYVDQPEDAEYPVLKLYINHACLGEVQGYYEIEQVDVLKEKIRISFFGL